MKIRSILQNALAGLVTGWLVTAGFSILWQKLLPIEERTSAGSYQLMVFGVILLAVALPAMVGGIIGGRIPREGGFKNQIILASIFGTLFVLPFACFIFWYIQW